MSLSLSKPLELFASSPREAANLYALILGLRASWTTRRIPVRVEVAGEFSYLVSEATEPSSWAARIWTAWTARIHPRCPDCSGERHAWQEVCRVPLTRGVNPATPNPLLEDVSFEPDPGECSLQVWRECRTCGLLEIASWYSYLSSVLDVVSYYRPETESGTARYVPLEAVTPNQDLRRSSRT